MITRIFQIIEDTTKEGVTLSATLATFENGERVSKADVPVSTLPGALCGEGAILGPVNLGVRGLPYSSSSAGDRFVADPPERTGTVPEPPKGKLPADFPGHDALDAAGVHTYGQVSKHIADDRLKDIPGIGKATATKIATAMGVRQ